MKHHKLLFTSLIVIFSIGLLSCEEEDSNPETSDTVTSEFAEDAEGWTIEGDASGGSSVDAAYSPFDGLDDSGYIYAEDDVAGGVWYFVAPSKYHGDMSDYAGGKISFWLIQESAMDDQFNSEDVILENGDGEKIYHYHEAYPGLDWTSYTIALDETGNWMNGNDEQATMSEIESVISDLAMLWIRGEYQSGPDIGGLDQFQMEK